jgi:hypothetical protein
MQADMRAVAQVDNQQDNHDQVHWKFEHLRIGEISK